VGPLLLVDTPWLLYRSFFGLPKSIKGADGRPVNALLGTVNAILNVVEWCEPRATVCCLGAEEAAYRVELYPPYHAHRDPMPEELRAQWGKAPALLGALGFHVACDDELEADDLIGSLARREPGHALILSADKDMFQCVNERVAVLELRRDAEPALIGPGEVRERSGVAPEQIPDLIALRGDPSDGIPGAKGIGAKGAASLLQQYGSLEGVLAAEDLRPALRAKLDEQAQELRMFLQVATMVDVELEVPGDRALDRESGAAAARELGMRRLAERLAPQ
jgi:DNA polymerase-1